MKKDRTTIRFVLAFMKFSGLQIFLIIFFSGVAIGSPSETLGQEILEKRLTLNADNQKIENVLTKIEKSVRIRFSYNPQSISVDKKVSFDYHNRKLGEILEELLSHANLTFEVVGDYIVITEKNSAIDQSSTFIDQSPSITEDGVFTVSGTVKDEQGAPLPGVNVVVKQTTNGTTTDADGKYTFTVDEGTETLVFTFIGYASQEIAIQNRTVIDVVMMPDIKSLEEVVVVGYGEQQFSKISGSVSVISAEKVSQNPTSNLSNTLVGQTAGIIATQRSGRPGEDISNVYIRGVGTTGNSDPIYVIDGIERSSADFFQINPTEIESVSVLKDAASAAVFGMRAGNGVILVTTKRGAAGKIQIEFTGNWSIQERTREPEFLGSYEFAKLYNEARANAGQAPIYSDQDLQLYRDQSSPDTHPSSDWLSTLKDSAPMQNYNLSATGGTEVVQYAVSASLLDQDGIIPSDNFKRYNFRSNIDAKVTETTRLSFDISGRNENQHKVYDPDVFRWMTGRPPNFTAIKWSNGTYSNGPNYLAIPENGYRKRNTQAFRGRMELKQELPFVDGLSVKGIFAYDRTIDANKNWKFEKVPYYSRNPDGSFTQQPRGATLLEQDKNDFQTVTQQVHLNYARTIGKSDVTGLVLYTQTKETWNYTYAKRENYALAIDEIFAGSPNGQSNNGSSGTSARRGVVGRVNWTYNSRYIVEGSFRADGSEQFAEGKRWGFFPSASAGYVISEESFLSDVSFLDFLKIRASYGVLGNDRLRINNQDQRFLYIQAFNQQGNAVFGDGDVQPGIVEGRLANPNVTWETVKKLNIGFDAIFWNGKLSATVDYFYDKRSDILGSRNLQVPALLGIELPVENFAKVDNKGIEVTLGHEGRINRDWRYSVGGNLTYAKNKVVDIAETETNPNIRRTGLPLGAQFGYRALGLFQTQEEVDAWAEQTPWDPSLTAPGDIKYEDVNEDGEINQEDRVYIGTSNTPQVIYGFNGRLSYSKFQLSFLFQGATGVDQYYSGEGIWPFFVGAGALKTNLDRWTPDNTDASEPRVLADPQNLNHATSSFWLKDASYLRLKNIELAYSIESVWRVKVLRVYVNANNVFTVTKIKNYDPENANGRGWDYPQFRVWNVGINLRF